jgi:gas vesicle protein
MKESLILGASSGFAIGAAIGASAPGDQGENAIKGAVLGGVVGGIASYFAHQGLESRDDRVRRETLMNLEHYDVLGVPTQNLSEAKSSDNCRTTREVDGKIVSIPCYLVNDQDGHNK